MTAELRAGGSCDRRAPLDERRDPVAHREHVVRRLLDRGLSPHTLLALLPDFRPVVQRVLGRD